MHDPSSTLKETQKMTETTATFPAIKASLATFITQRQQNLNIPDHDLAYAAGYDKSNVIGMIKAGKMRLPINKVTVIANLLKVSRLHLLGHVLAESTPELWAILEDLLPLGEVSATEVNLIRHLRGLPSADSATPLVLDGASVVALVVAAGSRS